MISEGSVKLDVSLQDVPSRSADVFFNPVMKLNRDINILLLNAVGGKLSCADILAGSGVRALRLAKECNLEVVANDVNPSAFESMKKNAKLNKVKIKMSNCEANKFLLDSDGFDYIDIDPFGSPNPWLDAAVKRVSRNGYLGVTATDTSALAGSHPLAGLRKYWAHPLKNHCMHELGVRILIRKIQLVGAQYSKALTPIFCHASQHYYRVYFECKKGKAAVDKIMSQFKCVDFSGFDIKVGYCIGAGPLWVGRLWSSPLVRKMLKSAEGEAKDLLETIYAESRVPVVGLYDYYGMCSKLKVSVPSRDAIISSLKKQGFKAAPSHFNYRCLRSDVTPKRLLASLSRLACP